MAKSECFNILPASSHLKVTAIFWQTQPTIQNISIAWLLCPLPIAGALSDATIRPSVPGGLGVQQLA